MSEFTPGPWRKGDVGEIMLNNKYREIISDDGKIGLVYGIIDQDNKANANLIAAAPELYLAAMESFKAILDLAAFGILAEQRVKDLIKELRSALDKADGKKASGE
jgi:hypothetical protein